jgi:hypothetical protein
VIICFYCEIQTKSRLDTLVKEGQYKDYSEVITVALENLAVLHREVASKGAVVFGDSDTPKKNVAPAARTPGKRVAGKRGPGTPARRQTKPVPDPGPTKVEVPAIFALNGAGQHKVQTAPLPADYWSTGQDIPLDRWIFGQYNRLLPAKANCRALANLLQENRNGVGIATAGELIAKEAMQLGLALRWMDGRRGMPRDEALATAFPGTTQEPEKGCDRYANQFVASVNAQGQVSGLLIDLKLINPTGGRSPMLRLTNAGLEFANLPNPILDRPVTEGAERFGPQEIHFLLHHICTAVPVEDYAYRNILAAILDGANTPESVDAALKQRVPFDTSRSLSSSFLSSQRSGAISRMADLGLVRRVREGVKVSYLVTDLGQKYRAGAL